MTTQSQAAKPPVTRFDAVIVGAGMVGAALAGLLAEAGMQVALVEAKASPLRLDDVAGEIPAPRVSALTPVSQRLLTHLGVWPAMAAARVTPYRYMQVWDAEGSGHIHFSADEAGTAVLGHIVENDVTQAALNQQVAKQPTLTRFDGVSVSALQTTASGRWLVLEDGSQLQTPLVIAADGARSALRALAGISVAEESMEQEAVVTTVRCAQSHGATARQAFIGGRPLAFLPLTANGDDRFCSIVWSTTPEHACELTAYSAEALGKALGEAFDHRLGDVMPVDSAYRFPLVQRHAQHYVQPNLALVGDAAHSIHPLAGQGANLGMQDALALAESLSSLSAAGKDIGLYKHLRSYERSRKTEATKMIAAMDGFKFLFDGNDPLKKLVRGIGLSATDKLSTIKNAFVSHAMGL